MRDLISRHPKLAALLALAALTAIAYGNSLSNGFQFDDYGGIVENPSLHDWKNISSFFTDPALFRFNRVDWRPVLQITYALDYAIGGADPTVFHVTSILFHVGAAWLIFLIAGEIDRKRGARADAGLPVARSWIYFIAAALFAVHTANTQTVDYIWARSSLLAAFFYLLAFYCYLRGPLAGEEQNRPWWHAAGVLAFALGLGAKATAVTLPAAVALYELFFLNPARRDPVRLYFNEPRRLLKFLPLIAVAAAYIAIRAEMLPRSTHHVFSPPWVSRTTYLLTQFRAWVHYLRLYAWPAPLILDYPGFGWSRSLSDARVLASLALLAALALAAWRARRREPLATFFTGWFFIALLPEASAVVRPDAVNGHRPYLAYAGLSVVAAVLSYRAAAGLWRRRAPRAGGEKIFRRGYAAAVAAALLALTIATAQRNLVWRDVVTLWSDVLQKDPANARGYTTLAFEYAEREDYDKAAAMIEKAIQLAPRKATGYFYRGHLNSLLEKNDEALADFTRAITLGSRARYFVHRGDLYRKLGRFDEALSDYRSALRSNPRTADAYFGIAMAHWGRKELEPAVAACRKVNEMNPQDRQGYACLGSLYMHQGRFVEALKSYYNGVKRFRNDPTLWYGLGTAYEELGLYREAQDAFATSSSLLRLPVTEEKTRRIRPDGQSYRTVPGGVGERRG